MKSNEVINQTAIEEKYVQDLSEVFCKIGKALTSSLDPKEVFRRVMITIGEYFAPQYWSLLLIEERTERLKFEIVMGVNAGKLEGVFLKKGEGLAGWVCQNNQSVIVEDVRNDPRFCTRIDSILGFTTKSVICVPLLNGNNHVMGAIELINKVMPESSISDTSKRNHQTKGFTIKDMVILSSIGTFAGVAIENAFLHQTVKEMAMIDSLTGLNNRHYFNEEFRLEVERVKRYQRPVCILMMDVDGLKTINDTHGHLMGDKALCAIANILKTAVRESDILARFGGDEFIMLIPMADKSVGIELSNRIQHLIDQWNKQSLIPGMKLGLSIGVYSGDHKEIDDILKFADLELYETKNLRKKAEDIISDAQIRQYLWENISQGKKNKHQL